MTHRGLLLALVLLAGCGVGSAWAEVPTVEPDRSGSFWMLSGVHPDGPVYEPGEQALTKPSLITCVDKMEAAMKAAEWFLAKPLQSEGSYTVPAIHFTGMTKEIYRRAVAMWAQWEEVSRDCWRKDATPFRAW